MNASDDRDVFRDQVTLLPSAASASINFVFTLPGHEHPSFPFSKLFQQVLLTEFV
jgi:hypothetical protein